jgi:tetratricopeptide (TPR) repeat protein
MLKKWDMVIDEAENCLLYDPKNLSMIFALGQACLQAKYIETAILCFEQMLDFNKTNVQAMKALGQVYQQQDNLQQAKDFFEKASKLAPQDSELAKLAKDAAAMLTTKDYGQAKSTQDIVKDKDKAKKLEKMNKQIRTEEDRREIMAFIKVDLQKDPNNKKLMSDLGVHHQELNEFEEANALFEKVLQIEPTRFDIKVRVSECKIKKIENQLRQFEEKIKQDANNAKLKTDLEKLKKLKLETEIREYDFLVKEQPLDGNFRFKLGVALFQMKRFDESIGEFQVAKDRVDAKKRGVVYRYLGQAFVEKKDYDIAIENFQQSIQEIPEKELQKDVLYDLGLAYEASKKIEQAIETFTQIYKEDLKYKDVGDRIKRLKK